MPTPQESIDMQRVEVDAMKLSPEARADLAEKLWLSVHSTNETDEAWEAESGRRIAEIDSGSVAFVPAAEIRAELAERLVSSRGAKEPTLNPVRPPELARRVEELDASEAVLILAEEVFAEARRIIDRHRAAT